MIRVLGLVLLLTLLTVGCALATDELAQATGRPCADCHLDPAGGGELTALGQSARGLLAGAAEPGGGPTVSSLLHLLAGYLHLLFGVLWFGTILYVHIVLKPAYAAQGLPRGEKRVGILSFFMMGISGAILTFYRFDSWAALIETRFGILLLIKIALYLLMLISAIVVIRIIGPRLQRRESAADSADPMSPAGLQARDGQQGRPAWFACAGKVYDASASRLWKNGTHMQRHAAGTDLTTALGLAPHGAEVLERLPLVGECNEASATRPPLAARLFFAVAYMNLGIVFIILFILALWRWG
jgi:predicted heme/steroid binding protein/uncharacterized membrane protein